MPPGSPSSPGALTAGTPSVRPIPNRQSAVRTAEVRTLADSETVYVVTGNHGQSRNVYHSREDCRHLQEADNYREVDRDSLWEHLTLCQTCENDGEQPTSTPWQGGHYHSLVEAAKRGETGD